MKPEQWGQIERLYHAALGRASDERSAFLDAACEDDQDLRREVESLLAYDEQAQNFIVTPPLTIAAEMLVAEQAPALVGSSVSHYQILSLLGRGGMGAVYLAQDITLGRKIALKLLPEQLTQDSERARRLEREAYAASATNHPNILTIHEIGHAEGLHFIATEFVDGVTLRQRMQGARISLAEMRRDGLVKVLDFGLAKLTERPLATSQALTIAQLSTEPGVLMGTISYMSPEQARGLKARCSAPATMCASARN